MLSRLGKAALGLVLVVAGIAMLVLPGPGLVAIAAGVALMLSQWPTGRRWLARVRVWARERFSRPRVHQVEQRIPDEVCPPLETQQLRVQAAGADDPSDDREPA